MERILKFRAYIPEAKHPYSENGMYYQKDQYLSSFLRRIRDQFEVTHDKYLPFSLSERLTQFTGLLDKEGNEIYEGDIVEFDADYTVKPAGWLVGVIKWDTKGAGYYFESKELDAYDLIEECDEPMKIIGNIFQHPHLIEKNK
jgi:uncharacterized phage protein (TIGR01671 family)